MERTLSRSPLARLFTLDSRSAVVISPLDIVSRGSLLGRNSRRHEEKWNDLLCIWCKDDLCEVVFVVAQSSYRPNIVGETRDQASRRLSTSILSTRREVQILEANILPSGDEGRIYLHDARPLNTIHLSRGRGRRSFEQEREWGARRRWRRGDGGRNFISARINFNDAEDAAAIRRGLKLRILWLQPVLRILCFSFFNLGPLVFHTISYEHTRPLSNPFSLYLFSRLLSPGAR